MIHSLTDLFAACRHLIAKAIVVTVSLGFVAASAATLSSVQQAPPKPAKSSGFAPGLSSDDINEAERRLSELGYWTRLRDGTFTKDSLRHALIAFQKVTGRQRTGRLTTEELQAVRTANRPLPLESGHTHVEIDLARQVLFIVDREAGLTKILPVSTGNRKLFTEGGRTRRAITPTGRFTVQRKINGWRKSPLGLLYYPLYIVGGVAIHGSTSVPAWPASHGCIRVPMFAAKEFSEMTPIGTVVMVYDAGSKGREGAMTE